MQTQEPKIRRPDEKSGGDRLTEEELARHEKNWLLARDNPDSRRTLRDFYQRCPWVYTELFQVIGVGSTENFDHGYSIAHCCHASAEEARGAGFLEESAALFITSARLTFRSYSVTNIFRKSSYSGYQLKGFLLTVFEGMGMIRVLPEDDHEYWEDRLAETTGAIFPNVAAFPFQGLEQIKAISSFFYVAQVFKNLVPNRPNSTLTPMTLADFDIGGEARIIASLAHLEVLADFSEDALKRMKYLLSTEISGLDDELYALMVGISAARKQGDILYLTWGERIHIIIDSARESFRSFEGRIFVVQEIASEFQYALQVWSTDGLHHAEDIFNVAEAFKSRNLLDGLGGCCEISKEPLPWDTTPLENDTFDSPSPLDGALIEIAFRNLHIDDLQQLALVSYWPLFAGESSMRMNRRWDDSLYENYLKMAQIIKSREEEDIAKCGEFKGSVRPATLSELQSALNADELLIEYFIPRDLFSPNRYCWIIVVGRDSCKITGRYMESFGGMQVNFGGSMLMERGPLSDAATKLRDEIIKGNRGEPDLLLKDLFALLFEPVIAMGYEPEAYRRWVLVPHGPLHLIPLHALLDDQGRHLIQRVPTTTVPSAAIWLRMLHQRSESVGSLLAVGNPYLGAGFQPLLDAEEEVNGILERAPWLASQKVLIGPVAKESRVKKEMVKADILHFAAHGEIDFRYPRDGHRILLSGDEQEDGMLLSSEIRCMNLQKVWLVVLNICNGVVCRYGAGDEPLGLLAAFINAGVENVLGGLWELNDLDAKTFIWDFYHGLEHGNPSEAFQRAACNAIEQGRALNCWAGLQFVGPARNVLPHLP